jgi:hypothetical protein
VKREKSEKRKEKKKREEKRENYISSKLKKTISPQKNDDVSFLCEFK